MAGGTGLAAAKRGVFLNRAETRLGFAKRAPLPDVVDGPRAQLGSEIRIRHGVVVLTEERERVQPALGAVAEKEPHAQVVLVGRECVYVRFGEKFKRQAAAIIGEALEVRVTLGEVGEAEERQHGIERSRHEGELQLALGGHGLF